MAVRPKLRALSLVGLGAVLCLLVLSVAGALDESGPSESSATSSPTPTVEAASSEAASSGDEPAASPAATDAVDPPVDDGGDTADAPSPTAPPATAAAAATEAADSGGGGGAAALPPPAPGASAFTFDTEADFVANFDYGFSGFDPAANRNPDRLVSWVGDHDLDCGAPTTQRSISIDRNANEALGGSVEDFADMFWVCREHLMTAVNAVGYNIAWFAPKPYYSDISRVCWDINVTQTSTRKWTQVLFVSETDALAHPSERGSGGYDLGYTNPIFRGAPGTPSAEILPVAGDLAGLQMLSNGYFRWFENQDDWTTELNESQPILGVTDKAARYTHCIEQLDADTIRFTQERPDSHGGFQQVDVPGVIPQGPVRVVFQDDNYNAPKGDQYDADVLTWHWDNIVIESSRTT